MYWPYIAKMAQKWNLFKLKKNDITLHFKITLFIEDLPCPINFFLIRSQTHLGFRECFFIVSYLYPHSLIYCFIEFPTFFFHYEKSFPVWQSPFTLDLISWGIHDRRFLQPAIFSDTSSILQSYRRGSTKGHLTMQVGVVAVTSTAVSWKHIHFIQITDSLTLLLPWSGAQGR